MFSGGPRRLDPRRGERNPKTTSNRASVCYEHDLLEEMGLTLSETPTGAVLGQVNNRTGRLSEQRRGVKDVHGALCGRISRSAPDTLQNVCQLSHGGARPRGRLDLTHIGSQTSSRSRPARGGIKGG